MWGHFPSLLKSNGFIQSHEIVFYGGFQFFNYQSSNLINQIIRLSQENQNVKLNHSRFEESFLVLAGVKPEKNYHFRHWINPFSGLLSAVESYGVSLHDLFKSPGSAGDQLLAKIHSESHFDFYQSLMPNLIGQNVEDLIEKSILDRTSFQNISFYEESGEIMEQENLGPQLLQNYIDRTLLTIDQISQVSYEKRN